VTRTDYDSAYNSVGQARRTLDAGFTSVRDLGAATSLVVAARHNQGRPDSWPRMWVGQPLGPTGGHSDAANGLDPALDHRIGGKILSIVPTPLVAVRTCIVVAQLVQIIAAAA
jgi:hypothetical protein